MRRNYLLFAIMFLVCSAIGLAQINTGKISGFVTDSSGAVITGVPVMATNDGTGVVTRTATSGTGEYLLNFLVPGTYHVEVEKQGFQKAVRSGVIVDAGGTNRVDFSLQVGNTGQTVEVQANPVNVATETSELSQNFSHQELDKLPNLDRNPLYQMNLIPGANNDVGSGNYGTNGGENGSAIGQSRPQLASIGGVDANANSVYIDGVPNREPQNAYISLTRRSKACKRWRSIPANTMRSLVSPAARWSTSPPGPAAMNSMARRLIFSAMKHRTRSTISPAGSRRRPFGAINSEAPWAARS